MVGLPKSRFSEDVLPLGDMRQSRRRLILIVDDLDTNRQLLQELVDVLGHQSITADNGIQALEQISRHDVDLVLLDLNMPEMDGFAVLERMSEDESLRRIPVVVISGMADMKSTLRSIELGADDYLPKPFNATLLATRIDACLEKKRWRDEALRYRQMIEQQNIYLKERVRIQVELIRQQTAELTKAQIETIFALSKLSESRDPETGNHLNRMREYCRALAEQMARDSPYKNMLDADFAANMYASSPLHDIGKVGIPDTILKKPGRLTPEEWAIMQQHTIIGAETLRAVNENHPGNAFVFMGIEVAMYHHECWNGAGYPYGLAGTDIPLPARILSLADTYDALTSKRCYKDAFSHEKSRNIILENEGAQFDPEVVRAFLEREEEFQSIRERLSMD